MDATEGYKNLITDIIKKQMDVLGAEMAVVRAKRDSVGGLGQLCVEFAVRALG